MIQAGKFQARAVDWSLVAPSGEGEPQVVVRLELLDGPDAGSHINWYGHFTDLTRERTFEALRNMGWKGNNLADLSSLSAGVVVEAVIQIKRQTMGRNAGKDVSEVRWINRGGGGGSKIKIDRPLDERATRTFAARMKSYAQSAPEIVVGPAAAAAATPAPRRAPTNARRPAVQDAPPPAEDDGPPF